MWLSLNTKTDREHVPWLALSIIMPKWIAVSSRCATHGDLSPKLRAQPLAYNPWSGGYVHVVRPRSTNVEPDTHTHTRTCAHTHTQTPTRTHTQPLCWRAVVAKQTGGPHLASMCNGPSLATLRELDPHHCEDLGPQEFGHAFPGGPVPDARRGGPVDNAGGVSGLNALQEGAQIPWG